MAKKTIFQWSFLIGKSERHMTCIDLMRGREPCPHKKRNS